MKNMKNIIQTIKKNKSFLISTHVNPDPDALCSQLAIAAYLRSLGKKILIINHEPLPSRFHFFPGIRSIRAYREGSKVNYDVAIVVDCGDLNRIGDVKKLIQKNKILINIDHHVTNDSFGSLNLIKPKASSTAEVLYEFFLKGKYRLTNNVALCLYAGIMTDTGAFRYENTSSRTHAIAGELIKFKFSPVDLYRRIYETISFKDLKEFTKVISCFDVLFSGQVTCVELKKKTLSKFSDAFDLRDAIFKFLRSIKDVEVFVIFTEVGRGETRVNFRSSQRINVAKLADHFGGGGHRRASGCMLEKNILEARKEVLKEIKRVL